MAAYDNRAYTDDEFITIRLEEKKVRFRIISNYKNLFSTNHISKNQERI